MKKFRTYKILGRTAYAKGHKAHYPTNDTIAALKALGAQEIVWLNGDFISI